MQLIAAKQLPHPMSEEDLAIDKPRTSQNKPKIEKQKNNEPELSP
ncbi:MAG: hypothetical protein OXC62_11250 [Aestuariivita sp.]|nr:hypothetical protein [Aestuariivita sp.]